MGEESEVGGSGAFSSASGRGLAGLSPIMDEAASACLTSRSNSYNRKGSFASSQQQYFSSYLIKCKISGVANCLSRTGVHLKACLSLKPF